MFVNYLSDVLPLTRRFSQPTCRRCNAPITTKEYILFQNCSNGHGRPFRHWVVLFAMIGLSLFVWLDSPSKLGYGLSLVLVTYFAVVFVIDMEFRLILHPTSYFGAALALVVGILSRGFTKAILGGIAGFLIMLAFYYFGVLFAKARAKRLRMKGYENDDEEALGGGDVILAGILGLALGWPLIWFSLFMTIIIAGVVGLLSLIYMVIIRRYRENAFMVFMPYGPFMLISAFAIIFLPKIVLLVVPQ